MSRFPVIRSLVPMVILSLACCTRTRAADVELLGEPCRARQILGTAVVRDRGDGRERLLLLNDNEVYHCEILSIDFERNAGEVFAAPAGAGSWCGIEVPGDKFVVGTFYDGVFMIFDLKTKTFTKVVPFPGEHYIWNLVIGADGRVYGGTYPGGKLGALDVEKGTCEVIGAPTPANQYLRYVSATPWGEIFCNLGMVQSTTRAYDVRKKTWREIPGLPEKTQFGVGVTWNDFFVASDPRSGKVEAFRDASLQPETERPFPVPGPDFVLDTTLSNRRTLYMHSGGALYSYTVGDARDKLVKVTDVQINGGRYVGVAAAGTLLGVRGQSYYTVKPGEKNAILRPIPVEGRGRPALFLEADLEGRIWGGPHFGQTLFYYDTRTGKTVNTDVVCDAGGEVYDVTFHKGVVYAASYSGGDITAYDPAKLWDQLNHKNPRPLASVAPRYIRPEAGIMTGPDGKLYAGWVAKYGTYGGAISITDPASGRTELIENPLGQQGITSIAVDDQYVYAGTTLAGNGLPQQKGKAKFGAIDLASRAVVFEREFDAASVTRVVREPVSGLVLFTIDSAIQRYDPRTKVLLEAPAEGLPAITSRSIEPIGDGTLLGSSDRRLVRFDARKGGTELVAESPVRVEAITIAADDRVYFMSGPGMYRVKEPIRKAAPASAPVQAPEP